ncbi:hypothetical protein KO516_06570 [Citreicella sp. C3M06]|uniref:hypothetical protein n=1 Tax=Citreicella sp. C3M06 TaxID=2841564 RepID=UPI001C08351B|nr:hypothetical protein [Citreicella sp. C3M06]MBU2960482.1 hypothetical protein [Citreicella sp. C3M06]
MTLTDTSAPIIGNDARLTPGSLILTDFTHSMTASGVPGDGGTIANIAWEEAAALLGSGSQSSLASTFINTFPGAPYGAFQRTANGALFGAVSTTDQGGYAARIEGAAAIMAYLAANTTREMACFIWADVERVSSSTGNLYTTGIGNGAGFSTSRLMIGGLENSLGTERKAISASGWSGSPNANASLNAIYEAAWGNIPPYNSLNSNVGQSFILYQYHLIDVAASGKTFAELDAADEAAYAAFFAEGGRGYGDSRTLDLTQYP